MTADDNTYRVVQPLGGSEPDEITLVVGNRAITFSDYRGPASKSRICPDVLLYGERTVEER